MGFQTFLRIKKGNRNKQIKKLNGKNNLIQNSSSNIVQIGRCTLSYIKMTGKEPIFLKDFIEPLGRKQCESKNVRILWDQGILFKGRFKNARRKTFFPFFFRFCY
jgi:hypothetical protein